MQTTYQKYPTASGTLFGMRWSCTTPRGRPSPLRSTKWKPGSWIGAGGCTFDPVEGCFLLSARPRKAENKARGYAANLYRSDDGESFELVHSIDKERSRNSAGSIFTASKALSF